MHFQFGPGINSELDKIKAEIDSEEGTYFTAANNDILD
jgi:hypothetical protein